MRHVNASVIANPIAAQGKPSFWPLQIAGWATYFILNATAVIGEGSELRYLVVSLTVTLSGFAITSLLRLGYRQLWALPLPRMAGFAAALLLTATLVQAGVYLGAKFAFHFCDDCMSHNLLSYLWYFLSMFYLLLSWSGLYFGIKFAQQSQLQKEAALRAQNAAHAAQLKMLRYQLNPHFLFNTLNAISTLVLDDKRDTAYRMVGSLSAFLRHSLDSDPEQRVSLAEEVDALRLYLGIEQLRFGDRLKVEMDIEPAARMALVPSLILQPLIENAIKYAVSKREEGGCVALVARRDANLAHDAWLDLHLRDDGPGFDEADIAPNGHARVGIANTRERLRVLYGERQHFHIGNREPHGVDVHIRLPFETARGT
ncbi:MAG: histidine kinase [Proteobacteria bacterium]|nr:histidine kinase [Pseudomonadota bacterium]